jgi:Flp pilus assembly pilin Flp
LPADSSIGLKLPPGEFSLEEIGMRFLVGLLRRADEDSGQTLVEYALIIAFIAIALVASLQLFSGGLTGIYADIAALFP